MIVTSLDPDEETDSAVVLACNDSTIKVISDQGKLLYSAILTAAPTSLSLITPSVKNKIICYGLSNGNIGAIELGHDESIELWEIDCSAKAPVTIVQVATLKDVLHLVVVRDDSTIELYRITQHANVIGEAELVFSIKEQEVVTGIIVGHVTSSTKKELIFSCYSGAIKTLVDRKHAKRLGTLTENSEALTDMQAKQEKTKKMTEMKKDVEVLQMKAQSEQVKVDGMIKK